MTLAIRRFIYVFNPCHQQEEMIFPRASSLNRQDFIWLITKASQITPLGYSLAQFVWLKNGCISKLAAYFNIDEHRLRQEMETFFAAIEQFTTEEETEHDAQF